MKLTKAQKNILVSYKKATIENLYGCYNRPSERKIESFNEIRKEMSENNGYGMKILSFNTFQYTCAYLKDDYLIYHTSTRKVLIPLTNIDCLQLF